MELNTGTIDADDIEDEVAEIARVLSAAGSPVVLVTYGFGCAFPDFDPSAPNPLDPSIDMPVSALLLPEFVEGAEENGVLCLGRSDLFFKTDDGRTSFLLCEFSDVHCVTDDPELFDHFHDRWQELYPEAYEADRELKRFRRLSGAEWQFFSSGQHGATGGG